MDAGIERARLAVNLEPVAAWYIEEYDCDGATDELRTGIRALNVKLGGENTATAGYHETLTRFWVYVVHGFPIRLPAGMDRAQRVDAVVAEFAAQRDLFQRFYHFDVVRSVDARLTWIPPDHPHGIFFRV